MYKMKGIHRNILKSQLEYKIRKFRPRKLCDSLQTFHESFNYSFNGFPSKIGRIPEAHSFQKCFLTRESRLRITFTYIQKVVKSQVLI